MFILKHCIHLSDIVEYCCQCFFTHMWQIGYCCTHVNTNMDPTTTQNLIFFHIRSEPLSNLVLNQICGRPTLCYRYRWDNGRGSIRNASTVTDSQCSFKFIFFILRSLLTFAVYLTLRYIVEDIMFLIYLVP